MTRVFVYGPLLGGEPNDSVLRRATPIGEARIEPRVALHDLGAFAGKVRAREQWGLRVPR